MSVWVYAVGVGLRSSRSEPLLDGKRRSEIDFRAFVCTCSSCADCRDAEGGGDSDDGCCFGEGVTAAAAATTTATEEEG